MRPFSINNSMTDALITRINVNDSNSMCFGSLLTKMATIDFNKITTWFSNEEKQMMVEKKGKDCRKNAVIKIKK